jgi:hypothetical protein
MNRLRRIFDKKPAAQRPPDTMQQCAACSRKALTSRQWYDMFESQGYWVNRLSGQAIHEGEMYSLDPLAQFASAEAQAQLYKLEDLAATRGYQCANCGRVYCLVCTLKARRHASAPVFAACPTCGGVIRTLEQKPDAQAQMPGRLSESRNWNDLAADWMMASRPPEPALWMLCANADMAQMLVDGCPLKARLLLAKAPLVVEFPDGSGAAFFSPRRGEDILNLFNQLMDVGYTETLVTLGGAAMQLPAADEPELIQHLEPEECYNANLDTMLWLKWGFLSVSVGELEKLSGRKGS